MKCKYIEIEYKKLLRCDIKLMIVIVVIYVMGTLCLVFNSNNVERKDIFIIDTIVCGICQAFVVATYIKHNLTLKKYMKDDRQEVEKVQPNLMSNKVLEYDKSKTRREKKGKVLKSWQKNSFYQ